MNRFLLAATVVSRAALRYTPAGLPALDLSLQHQSTVSEDGKPRQVSMEIKALAIGDVVQPLAKLALGSAGLFAGFITSTRNGRGLLFHITSFEPGPETAATVSASQDPSSSSN
jgi:primosomal replication protein N